MPEGDLAALHRRALDATGAAVAATRADQLDQPSVCDGWSVRDLLNHVISGNWWAAELMAGRTIEEVGDRLDGDVLGDDHANAYRASAEAAAAAFQQPGAMDAPAAVSYGPVPGRVYCGHRFLDVLVHGWDLAKSTGQDARLDPELAAKVYDRVVVPEMDMIRGSGAFGEQLDVPPGADAPTRLLAVLGRRA